MGRPSVTIDAAVLATAIGVERLLERKVRRVVLAEDAFRVVDEQARARIRRLLRCLAVILDLALVAAEAVRHIADRAPALDRPRRNFRRGGKIELRHG